jgi:hypothetical protein
MDVIEGRKVATCDIPGAFLQADWPADRDCYLKFEGAMVSMISRFPPELTFLEHVAEVRVSQKFLKILRIEMKNYSHHLDNGNVLNRTSRDIDLFNTNLLDKV